MAGEGFALVGVKDIEHLCTALAEARRVLRPGGALLVSFHIGEETRHFDEWWGQPVNLDFHFFTPSQMRD